MELIHSLEFEREVLAILFSDKESVDAHLESIKPEYFFSRKTGIIFDCMKTLYSEKKPIDISLVRNELSRNNLLMDAGGEDELADIATLSSDSECLPYYISELKAMWQSREIKRFALKISESSGGTKEIAREVEKFFSELTADSTEAGLVKFGKILQDVYFQIMDERMRKEKRFGTPTGFKSVDRMTSGFVHGDLVILAARPSVGKTTLAINMAINVAMMNRPVYIFSVEMTAIQLVDRIMASVIHLDSNSIKNGTLSVHESQELISGSGKLYNLPLYIDESGNITPNEIRARIKKLVKETGESPALIVVDHLQLLHMDTKGRRFENREKEMAEISRYFKSMAKELGTTVLAVSQLSRSSDKRSKGGDRPRLSDLRDSGALEQDADIVLLIHRPEAYDASAKEDGNPQCELIVGKARDGETGVIPMSFEGRFYQFSEITKDF